MSITLDKIILDAQRIANRVKDLEALGNALLVEAEGNNRQIETMKQFQDDIDSLNKLARNKTNAEMINRVNQQNPSLREFRQENRELKVTLEDHQRALELIMHKYREQIQNKVFNSRINFKEIYNANLQDVIHKQQEKINEMAAVMQKAAAVDDDIINNEIELITRLKIENQGLREMLQISKQFGTERIGCEDKGIQTEHSTAITFVESGDTENSILSDGIKNETIKKSIVTKVKVAAVAPETAIASTTTTAVVVTLPPPSLIKSTAATTIINTILTDQINTKKVKNVDTESRKSTLDTSSAVSFVTNGESDECETQEQVSS